MPEPTPDKRPKNREVEDEMIKPPGKAGKPPRPATQPSGEASPKGEPSTS